MIGMVAAVAALYFGRDVFIPHAIAILLTFALARGVSWLGHKSNPTGDGERRQRSSLARPPS
jgi:predicted PurR-regulated permease PerM